MKAQNKILFVIIITLITMVLEIFFGFITNSMALLADGFHMGGHALAFGLTYIAYLLCAKFVNCDKFKSGTDKIKELAGYTSSLLLLISGIGIIIEAVQRLFNPLNIGLKEALIVVLIGFIVNLISIIIMNTNEEHHHCHHHDNNFKSAYLHILADLLTSVFAIIALLGAKFFNLIILDPIIGIIGGLIIVKWAINLIKSTAKNLLDISE